MTYLRPFIFVAFFAIASLTFSHAESADKAHAKNNNMQNDTTSLSAPISTMETKQIETIIENYLMNNPQFVISMLNKAAVYANAEEIRKTEEILMSKADELYADPRDFFIGRADAPITVVEFLDYNCGYCKRSFPDLMRLAEANDDIRIIFKEYPILGPTSTLAAQTVLAAKEQGKYMDLHRTLFESKASLNKARLNKFIKQNGLDVDDINKRGQKASIKKHIQDTLALGQSIGITGTPAFIINDKLYPGALPYAELQEIVDEVRQQN